MRDKEKLPLDRVTILFRFFTMMECLLRILGSAESWNWSYRLHDPRTKPKHLDSDPGTISGTVDLFVQDPESVSPLESIMRP